MKHFHHLTLCALVMCCAFFSVNGFSADLKPVASDQASLSAPKQKVNINTATAEELETVKGIGKKRAQAIIAYRHEHGNFKSVEEMGNVKGIGKKRIEQISSQLTIN